MSRMFGKAGLTFALIAVVLGWIAAIAGPFAARQAVARGDYADVYTVAIVLWTLVVACDFLALALGIIGVRKPTGKAVSGAAIGISSIGVLGVLVNLLGIFVITPYLATH